MSTHIFISVGVLAVSRSPGIIRYGLRLDIAPMDTVMKQALLGVIAGYVAKNPRRNRSLSGQNLGWHDDLLEEVTACCSEN